jgi:hypothetical protein
MNERQSYLVHLSETRARYSKPLCLEKSRSTSYRPADGETVWIISQLAPPGRVCLGATGFSVAVEFMPEVQISGRPVTPCEDCLKILRSMSDRLEAQRG